MSLSLALLGSFEVRRDGQPVGEFRAQSARALLTYLALEADRPHEREHLCSLLWPDEPLQTALANLRQALHRLRQALEPEGDEGRYLLISRQSVQLNPTTLCSDSARFYEALADVAVHRHRSAAGCVTCAERLRQALSLYHGELLPGFSLPESERFETWLLGERERLQHAFGSLLDHLAAFHERRGEFQAAAELLRRWVALDPWHEDAHLRLMRVLGLAGQRTQVLRQFERYRTILANDLGIKPSPTANQLVMQVQAGNLTQPPSLALHNAPASATRFVGRTHEMAGLVRQLNDPDCRLLTLTGMGGSGKTRLASEAGRIVCSAFADGAVFVPLAAVQYADQVPELLCSGLGIQVMPGRPLLEQLCEAVRDRELLVVLDNCEQVVELGPLVAHLLGAIPGLTVLATSREHLDLRAEWVVPVGGLELSANIEVASGPSSYPAGQLFLQVAGQVQPAFTVGAAEASQVSECCTLLDGGPLAIELAATQLRSHSLTEIVARLRESLDTLATTMGDVPPRHRSLRAVFNWSWCLLDAEEQQTLAALSVFRGGCETAAAQAVVGAAAPFARLVAKSLLRRDAAGRYEMHEQIRQFAAEQLANLGLEKEAHGRHCTHYLELASSFEEQLDGPQEGTIVSALRVEHDNLRRAWEHAAGTSRYTLLSRAAPVFGQIYARSNLHKGVAHFHRVLEQLQLNVSEADEARQRILETLIGQLRATGQSDEAQTRAHELLALACAWGDRLGEARALLHLGDLAAARRDFPAAWNHFNTAEELSGEERSRAARVLRAHSLLKRASLIDWQQLPVDYAYAEQAYELYCALGMPFKASVALNRLGNQYRRCGDYGRSLDMRCRAVALIADQGDLDVSTGILNDLGEIYLLLGCYEQAHEVFERVLAMARRLGTRAMEVAVLEGLGRALFHLGELQPARLLLEQSLELDTAHATGAHRGYHLTTLGYVAERAGRLEAAGQHYTEAIKWWEVSGHASDAVTEPYAGLARVEAARGHLEAAMEHVEVVLPYLTDSPLQDALEPMWVHLSCAEILAEAGDWRGEGVRARARELLRNQAAHITDPALRTTFLTSVADYGALNGASGRGTRNKAA